MSDGTTVRVAAVQDALQSLVSLDLGEGDGLLIGWVVIMDVLAPDGRRSLISGRSESMSMWQAVGMLEVGRQIISTTEDGEE